MRAKAFSIAFVGQLNFISLSYQLTKRIACSSAIQLAVVTLLLVGQCGCIAADIAQLDDAKQSVFGWPLVKFKLFFFRLQSGALSRVFQAAKELALPAKEVNEFPLYACASFEGSPLVDLDLLFRDGKLTCFINRLAWTSPNEQKDRDSTRKSE